MAPSPEDDNTNTPKAPDKAEKKCEMPSASDVNNEKDKNEKTLSNLNDGELKALLDEAINYKNPKDREGKSKLFKDLLNQAEESERIARATSAGGSEVVRHYNSSARRNHGGHGGGHHGRHNRHRKQSSISENGMHGGSLDNLAKEELFLESSHYFVNKPKCVSARQREGGIIGVIDGTDIRIQAPPMEDYPGILFYNRKGFYSLNVQIICGADLTITALNPRYPGSVHDAVI